MLLAANWNAQIRAASHDHHSLDDVMRDLYRSWRKNPKREITEEVIDDVVRRYMGRHILEDIERFVVRGDLLKPDRDAISPLS